MSYELEDREKQREERRRVSRQQIIEYVRKPVAYTIFDVKWIADSPRFLAVGQYPNGNGAIGVYRLNRGELITEAEISKSTPLKCGTLGHNAAHNDGLPRTLGTGDFAGGLFQWDMERLDDAPVWGIPKAHQSIINAVDGLRYDGPPEIASASRDGSVRVWDTRQSTRPVISFSPADPLKSRDCWTVRLGNSFDPDERVLIAGYDNGDIKLFDMRMEKMLHEFQVTNGICDLWFDRSNVEMNTLIVSSLEGKIRIYDLKTLHPTLGYAYVEDYVTKGTIWASRSLPQNRNIFISGGGGELVLSKYNYPPDRKLKDLDGHFKGVAGSIEELNTVKIGDQPVNSIDWNSSKEGLLVCSSFDQTLRVMLVTKLSLVS